MPKKFYAWTGYKDSVNRDKIEDDKLATGSRNVWIDPSDGGWRRRGGTSIFADTLALAGLFEKKVGLKGRQFMEWKSDSLADGYPMLALLATYETTGEGTVGFRSTNGANGPDGSPGIWHTLGDDFSTKGVPDATVHYPYDGVNSKAEFIALPLKQRHAPASVGNTRDFNRMIDSQQRLTTAAGARRMIQMAGQAFCPALDGTPWKTRRVFNDSSSSGDQIERILPWGHLPPMGEPTLTFAAGDKVATNPNWPDSVSFYYTVAFIMEDDSISMPMVPRPPSALQPSGFCLFTVPVSGGGTTGYRCFTVSNIQRGPKGCKGRLLLRSPTVNTGVPSPNDLRIVATINNNSVTSYVDSLGSNADSDIVKNNTLVRLDHMWPWRGRHVFKFDERAAIGYLRPTASAFIAGPWKSHAGTVINVLDEDAMSATLYGIAITETWTAGSTRTTTLDLYQTAALVDRYDFATYTTLRDLIDAVNADVGFVNGAHWRIQGVPGADLTAQTTDLALTALSIPMATVINNATVNVRLSANASHVRLGMIASGTNIPTGSRVIAVNASGTQVTLDQQCTGTANITAAFNWEFGDITSFGVDGIMRCASCNYPAPGYMQESVIDAFGLFKQRIMFTSAEPGHARNAPQSFYVDNRLNGLDDWGQFMGGAELSNGVVRGIACFSKCIAVITNPKANSTGLDEDYRLLPLNSRRGCIAWDSIVGGDGWVMYLTADGYIVTDGVWERLISSDLHNVARGTGSLAYEIGKCRASAAADADDESFHAAAGEGLVYCSYRSASAPSTGDTMVRYDFGATAASSGLGSVMRQPNISHYGAGAPYEGDLLGIPYGWSAPFNGDASTNFRPGCMGMVRNASGALLYYSDDRNQGTTDGRVENFERVVLSDDGTAYGSHGYTVTDRFGSNLKKALKSLLALYTKGTGSFSVLGCRDLSRVNAIAALSFPFAASPVSGVMARYRREAPLALRSNTDTLEFHFYWTDAANLNQFEMFGIEADVDILDSYD